MLEGSKHGKEALDNRPWEIYILRDPETMDIRYVGITTIGINKRLRAHMSEASTSKEVSHRIHWLKSLKSKRLKPIIQSIESGIGSTWSSRESLWIKILRDAGVNLVNGTDGGEGCFGQIPGPETRRKMSESAKGKKKKPFSEEHKRNMSIAAKSRPPRTEEHRRKLGLARKGKTFTPEQRAKRSAAIKASWDNGKRKRNISPELREKLSRIHKQRFIDNPDAMEKALSGLRKTASWKKKLI